MGGLQHLIVPDERDHFLDAEDAMAGAIEAVGLAWCLGFGRRSPRHHHSQHGERSANRRQSPALPRAGKKYQSHKCSPVVERGPTRLLPPSVPLSRNKTKTIAGGTIIGAAHNNNGCIAGTIAAAKTARIQGLGALGRAIRPSARCRLDTALPHSEPRAARGDQRPSAVLSVSAASSRRAASEQRSTRSAAGRPLRSRG